VPPFHRSLSRLLPIRGLPDGNSRPRPLVDLAGRGGTSVKMRDAGCRTTAVRQRLIASYRLCATCAWGGQSWWLLKSPPELQASARRWILRRRWLGLRDAEAFRAKSIEIQETVLRALDSGIEAREAYSKQLDAIRTLETEVAGLKAWDAEKQRYELKTIGYGPVAYMPKPAARGSEPPHWLCPNCYAKGEKAFFQPTGDRKGRESVYVCARCKGTVAVAGAPKWLSEGEEPD
jgi:hypothetical protein